MKRYGSKKASRPYEVIHRDCGQCEEYHEVRTKSGRAHEKREAERSIREQLEENEELKEAS